MTAPRRGRSGPARPLVSLLLLAIPASAAGQQGGSTVADSGAAKTPVAETSSVGLYTEEQAERGETAFRTRCSACHVSSQFRGEAFRGQWEGRTAFDLVDQLRATMPYEAPGSLPVRTYVDVVAYLLRLNGYGEGEQELPWEEARLEEIRIAMRTAPALARSQRMSFFLTSEGPGNGADLGGLEGADAHCRALAEPVGAGALTWRAYLSTTATEDEPAVHARDRIGTGPWHNQAGVLIARDVEELHGEEANLTKETILTEKGEPVQGRGDTPNRHDILTGSTQDGMAFEGEEDTTCSNWTSGGEGSARVGHHDRQGGGEHPTSWNSAHGSRGCSQENLRSTGGDGLFYCFATDGPAGGGETPSDSTS